MASGSIQCLECRRSMNTCDCKWGPDHRARIVITLARNPITGKYPQIVRTFRGPKRAAKDECRRLLGQHEGRTTAPSKITMTGLLDQWLAHIEARGRSATTLYNYRNRVRADIAPNIGHIEVRKLTVTDLDNLYTTMSARKKGGSPASIRQVHAIIRAALNYAEKRDMVTRNVARHADLAPVRKPELTPPTPTEVQRLLEVAYRLDRDTGMAFRVGATTGARRASVVALRSSDLSFADNTILVERSVVALPGQPLATKSLKAGRGRPIAVDADTMAMLADHITHLAKRAADAGVELAPDHYLFSTHARCHIPMRPDTLTTAFIAARKAAGLPKARLHDLRHFVGTTAIWLGYDAVTAADRLIHVNPTMTLDRYAHVVSERARELGDDIGKLLGKQDAPQSED